MKVVLNSACWPSLQYCFYLFNATEVQLQVHDHYERRSFRNRYTISAANGPLTLSVPVIRPTDKSPTASIRICYKEKWAHQHQRSIESAYGKSPYFDFFGEAVLALYQVRYEYLIDFNAAQIQLLSKLLRYPLTITYSENYIPPDASWVDARFIGPTSDFRQDANVVLALAQSYQQCFDFKHGFQPNLSVLDLLFHEGLGVLPYLQR